MSKGLINKTNFSWGEFGASARGRIDLPEYAGGCLKVNNFDLAPQGPAERRGGSTFIKEVETTQNLTDMSAILIEFEFDADTGFAIVATNNLFTIVNKNTDEVATTIVTPYTVSDLPNLQWVSFGNLLYIVDGRNSPKQLNRRSDTEFILSEIAFRAPPAKASEKPVAIGTLASGNPQLVGSVVTWNFGTGQIGMSASDEGRILIDATGGQALIEGVTTSQVTVRVQRVFGETANFTGTLIGSPNVRLDITTQSIAAGSEISLTAQNDAGDANKNFFTSENQYLSFNGGLVSLVGAGLDSTPRATAVGRIVSSLNNDNDAFLVESSQAEFSGTNQPNTVTVFNGRLVFGGTNNNPQRVWFQ